MTLAAPATKPWETNCRRVTGRGWSGWCSGASGWRAPRRDFLFIVASSSLQQRAGAADDGRAGRLDHDFRAVRGAAAAAGREPADQGVDFGRDFRGASAASAMPVPTARAVSGPVTWARSAGVSKAVAAASPKLKPGKYVARRPRVVHELVAVLDRELRGTDLVRGQEALDVLDRRQLLAYAAVGLGDVRRSSSRCPSCADMEAEISSKVRRPISEAGSASGGGGSGVGAGSTCGWLLRADALEAQEELVRRRALVERDDRADARKAEARVRLVDRPP